MAFKVCVVGCGGLSTRAHGPSLRRYADQHPDVELAACCDLERPKAEAYRAEFGFLRAYVDFREMLAKEQPRAVCLMAPVRRTCEISVAIMEMGFPLLMEKPPGLNREECLRMIEAAEKNGVPNQVSFNRRYTPLVRALKDRLDALGSAPIQDIRYDFFRVDRKDADFSTTAIHGIDTAKFLAGSDYRSVTFSYQEFPELGPTVANIFLDCCFVSGARAHINFCPVTGVLIERATVCLQSHTFFLNIPIWGAYDYPGRLLHLASNSVLEDTEGDRGEGAEETMYISSGFFGENQSFLDDLRMGKKPAGSIRSGLQSVEIADCIRNRTARYPSPQ